MTVSTSCSWLVRVTFFFGLCSAATNVFSASITGWDFEDGTLQGWTMASASTIGPTGYSALAKYNATPSPTFWDPLGYNSKNPAYGFAAAPDPFDNRADPQDAPLVLRSPTFELHGGGQIIGHVLGGMPQADAVPPANFSALSGPSINTGEASPNDTSYQGLALRRESDGEYLLHKARTSNSSSYTGWQQLTFTEAELVPIIAANPGALFTLDLIDTAHGTFSSVNLDSVSVPSSSNSSLIEGGGRWTIRERVSAANVGGLADADALMALPSGDASILAESNYAASTINSHGSGTMNGHFANDASFVAGANDFALSVSGKIKIVQSGDVTFGFYANDGGRLLIDGTLVAQDDFGDLASDTLGTINLSAGVHAVEFLHFQNSGQSTVEIYVATTLGAYTSVNQASFELLAAVPEPTGLVMAGLAASVLGLFWRRCKKA